MDLSPSSTSALITSEKLCGCFAFIFRAHTHSHTVSEAAQLSPDTQFWFCAMALLVDTYIFHSDSLLYRVITQLLLGLWVQVQGFSLCNLLRGVQNPKMQFCFLFFHEGCSKHCSLPWAFWFSPRLSLRPTLPQVLSMGHSWSKHRVVHIILRQNSLQQTQVVC